MNIDFSNQDCLSEPCLPALIPQSIQLFILDLPYGQTQNKWDNLLDLNKLWPLLLSALKPKGNILFFSKQPFTTDIINSQRSLFRYESIWLKEKGTNSFLANKQPLSTHENMLLFSSPNALFNPQKTAGSPYEKFKNTKKQGTNYNKDSQQTILTKSDGTRFPISVLFYPRDHANQGIHPTQKPKELLATIIKSYSNPNDLICDPCAGSGSSIIGCLLTDRNFIGWELDPEMFNLTHERIIYYQKSGRDNFKKPKKNVVSQLTLD
jgi:site-specific DNA-methyltransferase (adenine-specific)